MDLCCLIRRSHGGTEHRPFNRCDGPDSCDSVVLSWVELRSSEAPSPIVEVDGPTVDNPSSGIEDPAYEPTSEVESQPTSEMEYPTSWIDNQPTTEVEDPTTQPAVPPTSISPTNQTSTTRSTTSAKGTTRKKPSHWASYIRHFRGKLGHSASKILFVVNFHEPRYEPVSFLDKEYFPAFRDHFLIDFDVVYVGPVRNNRARVMGSGLPYYGHFSYYSLVYAYRELCVKQQCDYVGFLLMNDDSYVDPLYLIHYDLTTSWGEPSAVMQYGTRWKWFNYMNTQKKTYKAAFLESIEALKKDKRWEKCHFERGENIRRGYADFLYLTKNDIDEWCAMADVMYRHRVFLEMAVPTMNWCVTHRAIVDCNHGKMKARHVCVHMHPVKYRQPRMKELAMNRLYHRNLDQVPPRLY